MEGCYGCLSYLIGFAILVAPFTYIGNILNGDYEAANDIAGPALIGAILYAIIIIVIIKGGKNQ